jgi:hypothetical protein
MARILLLIALWPALQATALVALVSAVQISASTIAHAQSSDDDDDDGGGDDGDDDGGDDGDDDDGDDDNDPGDPPDAANDLQQNTDDGDNDGPRDDDCFEEAALRPAWLRPCDDRPARKPKLKAVPVISPLPAAPVVVSEPENALPRELVALRLTAAEISALEARGFVVLSRSPGPLAAGELIRFEVPSGLTTRDARAVARGIAPSAIIDFNHIYRPAQVACSELFCRQRRTIRWPQPPNECTVAASIGLVDTTVDASIPALQGQRITILDGVSSRRPLASKNHGTAIAALLAGRSDASVPGLLPKSEIVSVQAFHSSETGEDIADVFDVASAVDTLVRRGLRVINLSFTGPNNRVLSAVVDQANGDGATLVAAAGNRGPTGPVVYPAGYESVVAVTAVGDDLRIYRGANRGRFVDFAAPGVDVQVVAAKVETRFETGTSFAAPFITAALAALKAQNPDKKPEDLVAILQGAATDLGRPGRDPVFGWGLVQVPEICP